MYTSWVFINSANTHRTRVRILVKQQTTKTSVVSPAARPSKWLTVQQSTRMYVPFLCSLCDVPGGTAFVSGYRAGPLVPVVHAYVLGVKLIHCSISIFVTTQMSSGLCAKSRRRGKNALCAPEQPPASARGQQHQTDTPDRSFVYAYVGFVELWHSHRHMVSIKLQ